MLKVAENQREKFVKAIKFAKANGKWENFCDRIKYLHNYAGKENTYTVLYYDFAPLSFGFTVHRVKDGVRREWFSGGLIFHGTVDNYGSGSAPTFAVTLSASDGWDIHT